MDFSPMLARQIEPGEAMRWPMMAAPKLDGVRCLVIDGNPLTRSMRPFPNKRLADALPWSSLDCLDGELVVGPETAPDSFCRTSSALMSADGDLSGLRFHVFDHFGDPSLPFEERNMRAMMKVQRVGHPDVSAILHSEIRSRAHLDRTEKRALECGYEGLILRDPHSPYRCGRAPKHCRSMIKIKQFSDAEAIVEDVDGITELSRIFVRDRATGTRFAIGTGFDNATRTSLWSARDSLPGQIVKYKFQKSGQSAPRFPVFLGLRSSLDL